MQAYERLKKRSCLKAGALRVVAEKGTSAREAIRLREKFVPSAVSLGKQDWNFIMAFSKFKGVLH